MSGAGRRRVTDDDDEIAGTAVRDRGRVRATGRWLGWTGWIGLGLLLAALAIAAATADRFGWPRPLDEEATYAMQAASLAFDGDLAFAPEDLSRFGDDWRMRPYGLVLQRRDGAGRPTFGRPFLYALFAAPWARLAPITGPQFANALWLAMAALLAARTLGRSLGAAAPWWVAALLFGSPAFASVFRVEPGTLVFGAVAIAFSLAYGGGGRPTAGRDDDLYSPGGSEGDLRFVLRWLAVGVLLAVPAVWQPLYLVLLVPAAMAAWAIPAPRRVGGLAALAAGAAGLMMATAVVQFAAGGRWTAFDEPWATLGASGEAAAPSAGRVEGAAALPAGARERSGARLPGLADVRAGLDRRLQGWNAAYLVAGRHTGLLPFYLPLLLPLAAAVHRRGRWTLVPAAILALAALSVLLPFDLFGGADALPGAVFLPLYPALWFLAGRWAPRPGRQALAAVVLTALAGLFLWPLWRTPAAYPFTAEGGDRFETELARRLPVETTQRSLPGARDLAEGEVHVRSLSAAVVPSGAGTGLTLAPGATADLLVASPHLLSNVVLDFERRAPAKIAVEGAVPSSSLFRPDGRVAFALHLADPRATHPTWWSGGADVHFWELTFHLPGARPVPLAFTVEPGPW